MAKTSALELASIASRVTTIGAARAVLGKGAELLHEAYGRLSELPTKELQDAAQSMLDQANNYGQQIYKAIGTDDPDLQDEEISTLHSMQCGLFLTQADKALERVEDAANASYWNFGQAMTEVLDQVASVVQAAPAAAVAPLAKGLAAALAALVSALWPWLLAAGGVIAALVYFGGWGSLVRKVAG